MDNIYFCDVGLRNMVIGNLAEPAHRDDMGHYWENFLVAERRKVELGITPATATATVFYGGRERGAGNGPLTLSLGSGVIPPDCNGKTGETRK